MVSKAEDKMTTKYYIGKKRQKSFITLKCSQLGGKELFKTARSV